jgi:hypothetical protein
VPTLDHAFRRVVAAIVGEIEQETNDRAPKRRREARRHSEVDQGELDVDSRGCGAA